MQKQQEIAALKLEELTRGSQLTMISSSKKASHEILKVTNETGECTETMLKRHLWKYQMAVKS